MWCWHRRCQISRYCCPVVHVAMYHIGATILALVMRTLSAFHIPLHTGPPEYVVKPHCSIHTKKRTLKPNLNKIFWGQLSIVVYQESAGPKGPLLLYCDVTPSLLHLSPSSYVSPQVHTLKWILVTNLYEGHIWQAPFFAPIKAQKPNFLRAE